MKHSFLCRVRCGFGARAGACDLVASLPHANRALKLFLLLIKAEPASRAMVPRLGYCPVVFPHRAACSTLLKLRGCCEGDSQDPINKMHTSYLARISRLILQLNRHAPFCAVAESQTSRKRRGENDSVVEGMGLVEACESRLRALASSAPASKNTRAAKEAACRAKHMKKQLRVISALDTHQLLELLESEKQRCSEMACFRHACRHDVTVLRCSTCDVTVKTAQQLTQHLQGKRHSQAVAERNAHALVRTE